MSHDDLWLRKQAVVAHEEGRLAYATAEQRSADLTLLADALECFWDHPNTPDDDKAALAEALKRLLGDNVANS